MWRDWLIVCVLSFWGGALALWALEGRAWQALEPAWMVPDRPAGCDGARGWGSFQFAVGVNEYDGATSVFGGTLIMTPSASSEIAVDGDAMLCVTGWQGVSASQWTCPCPSGAELTQSSCDAVDHSHWCGSDATVVACSLTAPGDCGEPAAANWQPPAGTVIEFTEPNAPTASLSVNGSVTVPSGGTVDVYLPPEGPARGWPVLLIQADIDGTWIAGTLPADTELHHDARGLWLIQSP